MANLRLAPPPNLALTVHAVAAVVAETAPGVSPEEARTFAECIVALAADQSAAVHVEQLLALTVWLNREGAVELPGYAAVGGTTRAARLWLLVEVLRRNEPARRAVGAALVRVLRDASAASLFTQTGLPNELRIFSEVADRIARRLLPATVDDTSVASLIARAFPTEDHLAWLEAAGAPLVAALCRLLFDVEFGDVALRRLENDAVDAVMLLAVRAASIGTDADVRARAAPATLRQSPFLELPRACDVLTRHLDAEERTRALARVDEVVRRCRDVHAQVGAHLEAGSVSVDLVFRLELLQSLLDRIGQLCALLDEQATDRATQAAVVVRELARAGIRDRSLSELLSRNTRLLARKIIDSAGETGEHYITATRAGYHQMITSAGGGGVVMAFTAIVKFQITAAQFPYFFQMLFYGGNYSGAFLLMQAAGFTLATKQPSMTAATLAGVLGERGRGGLEALAEQVARTARSQLAAIIGNLGVIIPAAIGVHFASLALVGTPILDVAAAKAALAAHDPLTSGTIFYAAVTGVLLWASSIVAGFVDNWSVYRKIPEAIEAAPRIRALIGRGRAKLLARWFRRNIAGISGNLAIGYFLGITPIVGKFFGLPLDIRHVTISTATVAFAGATLGPAQVLTAEFGRAVAGIAMVALLNFTVSFTLAVAVAFRAKNVPSGAALGLPGALWRRFWRHPWSFFVPPKVDPADTQPPH